MTRSIQKWNQTYTVKIKKILNVKGQNENNSKLSGSK